MIDRGEGEDEGGVDALDDDWLPESAKPLDLIGAAGDGSEVGTWILAKLGIDCAVPS